MNLQALETELKEHLKVEARTALANARAELSSLANRLKALESGASLESAKKYLEEITAKVHQMEADVAGKIQDTKLEMEKCLKEIEGHKQAVKDANQATKPVTSPAPAPAPTSLDTTVATPVESTVSSDSSTPAVQDQPAVTTTSSSGDTSGQ